MERLCRKVHPLRLLQQDPPPEDVTVNGRKGTTVWSDGNRTPEAEGCCKAQPPSQLRLVSDVKTFRGALYSLERFDYIKRLPKVIIW